MIGWLPLVQVLDLDQPVTLDGPVVTAPTLVKRLGGLTNVAITLRAPLDRNTLLVRCEATPLRTVLDRVATALSAEWKIEDGKRVEIFRSAETVKRLSESHYASVEASLRKAVHGQSLEPFDEPRARSFVAEAASLEGRYREYGSDANLRKILDSLKLSGPAGRALTRGLLQLPLTTLARMKRGQRTVYANTPNRMQTELKGAEVVIKEFNRERTLIREVIGDQAARESKFNPYDPRYMQFALRGPATRFLLAVHRRKDALGYSFEAMLADRNGAIISKDYRFLSDAPKLTAPTFAKSVVDLPELSRRVITLYRSPFEASAAARADFGPLLAKPSQTEWQDWLGGSLLRDYSKKTAIPIVTAFSDRLIRRPLGADPRSRYTSDELANLIAEFWDLKCTEVGGWLIAKPNSPLVAEEEFLDRGPLERVLRSLISEKHLSLEVASAYAQQAISSQAGLQVEGRMVSAIGANGPMSPDREMISVFTYPALRLYSALTSEQKLRGECPVSELTDSARATLTDWLFHSVLRTQAAEVKFNLEQPFRTLALSEITETLPNGLRGDLKITAKIEETPLIAIKDGEIESVQAPPDAAFLVDPEFAPNVLVEALKSRVLRVTLTLPGGLLVPVNIYESPPALERKWVKISELPSDVLDLLRSELKKQNDQFPDFTLPGVGVPPPHIR